MKTSLQLTLASALLAQVSMAQSLTRTWWDSGHQGPVHTVAASNSGLAYLTSGADGTVRLWQPVNPKQTILPGPTSEVFAADLRADGATAAYADQSGKLFLYQVASSALTTVATTAEGRVRELRFAMGGSYVATAGDGGACIRLSSSGAVLRTLVSGGDATRAIDADAGQRVVTGRGNHVTVWDAFTGAQLFTADMGMTVTDVAISESGGIVAALAGTNGVRVWNSSTAQLLVTLPDVEGAIRTIEFAANGAILMLGDGGGGVHCFVASTGQYLASLSGHVGEIRDLSMLGSTTILLTASADGTSWAWNLATLQPLAPVSRATGSLWTGGASTTGKIVSTGSLRRIYVQDAAAGTYTNTVFPQDQSGVPWIAWDTDDPIDRGTLQSVDIDSNGTRIVGGGTDGYLKLWDAASGSSLFTTQLTTTMVTSVRLSPNGSRAFAATFEGSVSAWDTQSNTNLWTIPLGNVGVITRIAVSDDGTKLALSGNAGRVDFLNAQTGQSLGAITNLVDSPADLTFSASGLEVAFCDGGDGVQVWQIGGAAPLVTHRFVGSRAAAVTRVPGQNKLLAAAADGTVVTINLAGLAVTSVAVAERPRDVIGAAWSAGQLILFDRLGMHAYTPNGI